ncbi:MAG: hypothetical protein V1934_05955 [Methanobacteriota archaeon]
MSPKIGESLKRIVDDAHEPRGGHAGEFALTNPNRLAVYQSVIELVIARSGTVSRLSGLTRKASRWHLTVLAREGFVEIWDFDGTLHYSPAAAVADIHTVGLLLLVSGKAGASIIWASMTKPGCSVAYRSKSSIELLADAELVSMVGDGKTNRLYPGTGLKALSKAIDCGYDAHKAVLVKLCHQGAVKCQANPLKDGSVDYGFAAHSGDYSLTVPSRPFENSMTRRAELYNLL